MKLAVTSLVVLLGCLLTAAAHAAAPGATPGAAEIKEFTATVDADGVQRVEIVGGSYFFSPNRVVVKVNVPVELKITREAGPTPHSIVINAPEAAVSFAVEMTEEPRTIRFTPTAVGAYPIYCDKRFLFFSSHRERGMEGVLVVTE